VAMNAPPTLPWRNPGDPYPEILALPLTVAETMELFDNPLHPYTKALLSAVPTVEAKEGKKRIILEGTLPLLSILLVAVASTPGAL